MAPQKPRTRISFEARVFYGTLLVTLPGMAALVAVLVGRGWTPGQWSALLVPVVLVTLALAVRLRNRVAFPLYTVSNLLEALREGDYSLRGSRARRGDAIGEVIWEVNALGQTLREQRLKVEETLTLLTKVMHSIDLAIFAFDATSRLRLINPAGERLLDVRGKDAVGRSADELDLADCLAVQGALTLRRAFPGGSGSFEIRRATFRESGLPHQLVVITDLSRALREEERAAWQRLIRVLGHELNNSLTPIKSMAGTLAALSARESPPSDWRDDLRGGLQVIGDRADALTRFMLGYTTLARLPPPSKRRVDLCELVRRVARLEQRVPVTIDAPVPIEIAVDPDQIEQTLINIIKNGAEAALPLKGGVLLRCVQQGTQAVIEIEDEGPGVSASENLFVPFFTTKPGGSGIGLVLARQIVEAHGGDFHLLNRRDRSGAVARITLPL
jgi:two-component system nitrogen regulation sensor histidine kinase NtrY